MDDLDVANGAKLHISYDIINFRKSSKSNFSGNCVEVAAKGASVLVRDSKNPGTVVQFSPSRWTAFMACVKKMESQVR